jgi:hypothetical protein
MQNTLTRVLGEGNWTYNLDYNNYELEITVSRGAVNYMHEMRLQLAKMIPANIVYDIHVLYSQHQSLRPYTHEFLSKFTHYQLRTEDLE